MDYLLVPWKFVLLKNNIIAVFSIKIMILGHDRGLEAMSKRIHMVRTIHR